MTRGMQPMTTLEASMLKEDAALEEARPATTMAICDRGTWFSRMNLAAAMAAVGATRRHAAVASTCQLTAADHRRLCVGSACSCLIAAVVEPMVATCASDADVVYISDYASCCRVKVTAVGKV